MNNSRLYLEARTISGPLSLPCLSVGSLFTCAQTKQVFGVEKMLLAFVTIVKSDARCKELYFLCNINPVSLASVGEMRYDGAASVVGKSC